MSWMVEEIRARGGGVSFRDFMELALYHPLHGYYTTGRPKYGRGGDFLTAPTSSRWYGRILASWTDRLHLEAGPLAFVDLAAGDGRLVQTLAEESHDRGARTFAELVTVERSEPMRAVQSERFAASGLDVRVRSSVDELVPRGCATVVHASELFDALPVHRVVVRGGVLREMTVRVKAGALAWGDVEATEGLTDYFAGYGVNLIEGQLAEVNLEAGPLLDRALDRCGAESVVVILDYGYPARRLYNSRGRRGGSLVGYREHSLEPDLLRDPGKQDLTAHVNWDDLEAVASNRGWGRVGVFSLAEFLVRAGIADAIDRAGLGEEAELDAETIMERQEIKRLLDPEGMGSDLKVLIIGRGEMARIVSDSLTVDL